MTTLLFSNWKDRSKINFYSFVLLSFKSLILIPNLILFSIFTCSSLKRYFFSLDMELYKAVSFDCVSSTCHTNLMISSRGTNFPLFRQSKFNTEESIGLK